MIGGQTVLAIVTARGGSKRIPRKNLRRIAGKTLIARAIESALGAQTVDRTIVSSDDAEIIATSLTSGADVPFIRPQYLADDQARSVDVIRHALDQIDQSYDFLVLVQPTSPLRTPDDIDAAVRECSAAGVASVVSVSETHMSPFHTFNLGHDSSMIPIVQAPNIPPPPSIPIYAVNGAVYVVRCDWFQRHGELLGPDTRTFVMPRERSVDIDDELDLLIADTILSNQHVEQPSVTRHDRAGAA